MPGFSLDLKEQLVFYGSYHSNFWNQIVHVIFVPVIFWSLNVWLAYTPSLFDLHLEDRVPQAAPDFVGTIVRCALRDESSACSRAQSPVLSMMWPLALGEHPRTRRALRIVGRPSVSRALPVAPSRDPALRYRPSPPPRDFGADVDAPHRAVPLHSYLNFNAAAVIIIAYGSYYISLTPFIGLIWVIFQGVPILAAANAFVAWVPNAWAWAILAHVIGWFAQIKIGHLIAEKRRPALFDSFFQSLVLAHLFVTYEVAFWLGYNPKLRHEIDQRVAVNIAIFRAEQQAKKAADGSDASNPLLQ